MDTALDDLKARLLEVRDLRAAAAVLHWDQATYMPPGGAPARGRQLATLRRLAQEKFTDPAVGRLLDTLEPWAADQDPDGDTARLVRVTRWDYDRAVRIPVDLVAEMSRHGAAACQAWRARPMTSPRCSRASSGRWPSATASRPVSRSSCTPRTSSWTSPSRA